MTDPENPNQESQTPGRHLNWPDCYNTRDLGGLPAKDGAITRWRSVIRSDILNRLTDEGQRALLDYGVRTIIDLRSSKEAAEELSFTASSADRPLDYYNLPIEKYYPHVSAMIQKAKSRGEVYCIILDHYPDAVAEILRAMVNAPPGGIVIHCHAGKDRTGMVSALLLALVGVPAELIAADYAESQHRLWPLYEKNLAEAGDQADADLWQKPTATADMMLQMMEHVDAKYGGIEPYLRAAGLTDEELKRLRERLV
jgi:protein-tyrosine phosphatase